MKIFLLLFISVSGIAVNAQKDSTFVRNVQYEYNIHSLVPGFLHQLSDSTYLTIMYLDKGSPPPYYIRYNRKGKPFEMGRLSLPNSSVSAFEMLFTSDDGLLYMASDAHDKFAVKFDKNMQEQWRMPRDSSYANPTKIVISEAEEINETIYGLGSDSSFNDVLLKVNLTTGTNISQKKFIDKCSFCTNDIVFSTLQETNNGIYVQAIDYSNSSSFKDMKIVSSFIDSNFSKYRFDTVNHLLPNKPWEKVNYYLSIPDEKLIIFSDVIVNSNNKKIYTVYDSTYSKNNSTTYNSNLSISGPLSFVESYKDNDGNQYFLCVVGDSILQRSVHVVYKVDPNGKLLQEYLMTYEKDVSKLPHMKIFQLIRTKQGGFAFYCQPKYGGITQLPHYLVVTDSNFNVNGKPFYSQFVKTSINESSSFQNLSVFPNPTSSNLTISAPNNPNLTYSLLDLNGRQVLFGEFSNNAQLDVSELKYGMYFLRILNADNGFTETRKVIVGR